MGGATRRNRRSSIGIPFTGSILGAPGIASSQFLHCINEQSQHPNKTATTMMENHEENVDDEEDDIVQEYASTPADLGWICNRYHREDDHDEDGNAFDYPPNPALPFCLNIVSSSIRNIPGWALYNCRTLTDVRVQQGGRRRIILRSIGERAFECCSILRRINELLKQGGVIRLEFAAFAGCGIDGELIIPSSVVLVGGSCFCLCALITSVVFEASSTGTVVEIGRAAFTKCTELSSATLPPTLEHIPPVCFSGCTALINVPIPPNVVEIGQYAFSRCESLPSMELPESLDAIGRDAFFECSALTTVTIRTKSFELRMGDNIFRGCDSLSTLRTYPWHWGKLLLSMENDGTFLDNFFNGVLTPLHQIDLTSWYGARILESVKDQPSLLYRVFRKFQHQQFETTTDRVG